MAAILEEEFETLRKLKIEQKKEANGDTSANGGAVLSDAVMADATGAEEEDPEPRERGSEAVERRIEKVMADIRDQGLVDAADEKALEAKKVEC